MIRRVAIIGGGPGGLMTAYQLQKRCPIPVEVTLYEATERLGGKVLTEQFGAAAVSYEAGAAELYDYSQVGQDPLRELVEALGLNVKPMAGASIVLHGQILDDLEDVARVHGPTTRRALLEFDERAKAWMSPEEYYDADWRELSADPKSSSTFEDELQLVLDATARQFLRTMIHSDLATEPHRTSASYGLQNYLMNDDRYMRLYTIDGGIEQLVLALADRVEARVLLRQRVTDVDCLADGRVRVVSQRRSADDDLLTLSDDFDYVVAALPNHYLPTLRWSDDALQQAMRRHYIQYDYPAHYLRVSVLFREVFWRDVLQDSYFMLDAFGGCCLYDESSRNGSEHYGALGWLLAGDAATAAANLTDDA
ncbi:MAG: flavin monoamine oxidase family protein, partial [Janthinobacterium lividum]